MRSQGRTLGALKEQCTQWDLPLRYSWPCHAAVIFLSPMQDGPVGGAQCFSLPLGCCTLRKGKVPRFCSHSSLEWKLTTEVDR